MNLKREGAAIRALLDRADGIELSAETALEKARMDADEWRWEAAERCATAFEASGLTQRGFADRIGIDGRSVSSMLRAWEMVVRGGLAERPRFHDAVEMVRDAAVAERAERRGISAATQARQERRAQEFMRDDDTAKAIMRNPIVRESARHAIVAAEAEEARQRLMASANPVDLPLPTSGFNWLDADASLNQSRKLVHVVMRMIKDNGPLSGRDTDAILDGIRDIRIALDLLESMVKTGDMDEALARLLEQEA